VRLRFSLRSWLLAFHLAVLALPLLALAGTGAIARMLQEQARSHLVHEANVVATLAAAGTPSEAVLREIEATTGIAVEVLDGAARVAAASDGSTCEDRSDDDAVVRALRGESAVVVTQEGADLLRVAVAVPVRGGGAVRLSQAPPPTLQAVLHVGNRFVVAALLALVATCALALTSGHLLSRSLRSLSRTARRLGDGALDAVSDLERPSRSHLAEVARLSSDLGTMAERLKARLGYIREFARSVAHEFRTPITTLRGTMELLRDDPEIPPEQRSRFLGNALQDLDRLDRLVGGLLDLARAEEGGRREQVDLDALVRGFDDVEIAGSAGVVTGDGVQIETAIRNLVDNAQVHGGDAVHVRAVLWREGPLAGVDIVDDGPGISEANLPRVFDRFFTTGRGRGCVGLGLALVRAIARGHGGDVTVESRPGQTRFRFGVRGNVAGQRAGT